MRARTVAPVSPGEVLDEDFLKPLGLRNIVWPKPSACQRMRIGDIVAGKCSITADTDLRLCAILG